MRRRREGPRRWHLIDIRRRELEGDAEPARATPVSCRGASASAAALTLYMSMYRTYVQYCLLLPCMSHSPSAQGVLQECSAQLPCTLLNAAVDNHYSNNLHIGSFHESWKAVRHVCSQSIVHVTFGRPLVLSANGCGVLRRLHDGHPQHPLVQRLPNTGDHRGFGQVVSKEVWVATVAAAKGRQWSARWRASGAERRRAAGCRPCGAAAAGGGGRRAAAGLPPPPTDGAIGVGRRASTAWWA